MFTGKSPSSTCSPAGRSDHWFGNSVEPSGRSPGHNPESARAGNAESQANDRSTALTRPKALRHILIVNQINPLPLTDKGGFYIQQQCHATDVSASGKEN